LAARTKPAKRAKARRSTSSSSSSSLAPAAAAAVTDAPASPVFLDTSAEARAAAAAASQAHSAAAAAPAASSSSSSHTSSSNAPRQPRQYDKKDYSVDAIAARAAERAPAELRRTETELRIAREELAEACEQLDETQKELLAYKARYDELERQRSLNTDESRCASLRRAAVEAAHVLGFVPAPAYCAALRSNRPNGQQVRFECFYASETLPDTATERVASDDAERAFRQVFDANYSHANDTAVDWQRQLFYKHLDARGQKLQEELEVHRYMVERYRQVLAAKPVVLPEQRITYGVLDQVFGEVDRVLSTQPAVGDRTSLVNSIVRVFAATLADEQQSLLDVVRTALDGSDAYDHQIRSAVGSALPFFDVGPLVYNAQVRALAHQVISASESVDDVLQ
jgi:hypothetical protein